MKLAPGANIRVEWINTKDEEFLVDAYVNPLSDISDTVAIIRVLKKNESGIKEIPIDKLEPTENDGIMEALDEKAEEVREEYSNRVDYAMKREYNVFEETDDYRESYDDYDFYDELDNLRYKGDY